MYIGVSTATLYPMLTEEALLLLAERGFRNIEIFANCDTELQNPVRSDIGRIIRDYSLNILSLHPMPWWEIFFLFSTYRRRVEQCMEAYRLYFERMNEWGIKVMVFHGGSKQTVNRSDELYLERYAGLLELAEKFGITVAQENVSYCKSGDLDFLVKMKKELGDRAKFTLDLKQALRAGCSAFDILEKLSESIVHVHASDSCEQVGDCLPIGRGNFDFPGFFKKLSEINYEKGMVLELYRENYSDYSEIDHSIVKLNQYYTDSKNERID
ncbi:MAG: sugar phosphate isomerase/epimerase [Oscillospiraceae bacterium]|nr:sugar phosphate isomerase/epimerase [Oscillospiraceae bacterium]